MRVLVVEDERRLARLLARGLGEAGHDVDVRHTGLDGLLAAPTGRYDAVVLDVMLPGMDGITVCQTMRRNGHTVPVLMLTARGEIADRVRASTPAPTTTWANHSRSTSSSPGCGPCTGAPPTPQQPSYRLLRRHRRPGPPGDPR